VGGQAGTDVRVFPGGRPLKGRGKDPFTAHGTLYKALSRMTEAGYLTAEWEDPALAETERRPRRRLYRISADGRAALSKDGTEAPSALLPRPVLRPVHP